MLVSYADCKFVVFYLVFNQIICFTEFWELCIRNNQLFLYPFKNIFCVYGLEFLCSQIFPFYFLYGF